MYWKDPERLALGALRETQRQLDRPVSWLALRDRGIALDARPNAAEREVLFEFAPALRNARKLTVYDIGANRGHYAAALAKTAAVATVIAFEPLPNEFAALQFGSNPKIRAFNFALGSSNTTAVMNVNDFSPSSSLLPMASAHVEHFPGTANSSPLDVHVRRLDDVAREFALPMPDIVKMDVQGYESEVIAGGVQAVSSARWLLVEILIARLYDQAPTFDDLYQQIGDLGFSLYTVTDELLGASGDVVAINCLFRKQ